MHICFYFVIIYILSHLLTIFLPLVITHWMLKLKRKLVSEKAFRVIVYLSALSGSEAEIRGFLSQPLQEKCLQ